jgi:hypothetical protein
LLFTTWASGAASKIEARAKGAKEDGKITIEEYDEMLEEFKAKIEGFQEVVKTQEQKLYNLFEDVELNSKYQKTHDYFIEILKIIMYDKEKDYPEVIANFTKAIDNEKFINGHQQAFEDREKRLERAYQEKLMQAIKERKRKEALLEEEYQKELREYEIELEAYKLQIEQRKSKNFFKKLFSDELPEPPKKPIRKN